MDNKANLLEQESFTLITSMMHKAIITCFESARFIILLGSTVMIATVVSYLKAGFQVAIDFDTWMLVLAAMMLPIFISIKERKNRQYQRHNDIIVNTVWLVYPIKKYNRQKTVHV